MTTLDIRKKLVKTLLSEAEYQEKFIAAASKASLECLQREGKVSLSTQDSLNQSFSRREQCLTKAYAVSSGRVA